MMIYLVPYPHFILLLAEEMLNVTKQKDILTKCNHLKNIHYSDNTTSIHKVYRFVQKFFNLTVIFVVIQNKEKQNSN